jgi:hypothetical protein
MADGVDPGPLDVQATGRNPMRDRAATDAQREQLPSRDRLVLPRRKLGDHRVHPTRAALGIYFMPDCESIRHAPSVAEEM